MSRKTNEQFTLFIHISKKDMCKRRQPLLVLLALLFTSMESLNISSCISNTPCKCRLTESSFTLTSCEHSLPNLPIINWDTTNHMTKIVARNALIHWPTHLCQYSRIEYLDLSGSYFHWSSMDILCLDQLIHLNLSQCQLKTLPKNFVPKLQILDLSNNQIESLDGQLFRLLTNLIRLYLQNNPFKQINHFEYLLSLSRLESVNLMSSNPSQMIPPTSLTSNQWIHLASKWKKMKKKSLTIQTNSFSIQSLFPNNSNQFQLISLDLMQLIFRTLANSTMTTAMFTPKCTCMDLRNYQRVYAFVDNEGRNLSKLFRTSTCLMSNGIIHARLFDRRTLVDLHCHVIEKKALNTCAILYYHLFLYFLILYCFY